MNLQFFTDKPKQSLASKLKGVVVALKVARVSSRASAGGEAAASGKAGDAVALREVTSLELAEVERRELIETEQDILQNSSACSKKSTSRPASTRRLSSSASGAVASSDQFGRFAATDGLAGIGETGADPRSDARLAVRLFGRAIEQGAAAYLQAQNAPAQAIAAQTCPPDELAADETSWANARVKAHGVGMAHLLARDMQREHGHVDAHGVTMPPPKPAGDGRSFSMWQLTGNPGEIEALAREAGGRDAEEREGDVAPIRSPASFASGEDSAVKPEALASISFGEGQPVPTEPPVGPAAGTGPSGHARLSAGRALQADLHHLVGALAGAGLSAADFAALACAHDGNTARSEAPVASPAPATLSPARTALTPRRSPKGGAPGKHDDVVKI